MITDDHFNIPLEFVYVLVNTLTQRVNNEKVGLCLCGSMTLGLSKNIRCHV